MHQILVTGDWTIDCTLMSVTQGQSTTKVRPRTFALLQVFLNQPQQILSKQYLLDTVWDDVVVSEQVLFQTVREIRNLFGDSTVIKTQPRKGYCWTLDVQSQQELTQPESDLEGQTQESDAQSQLSNEPEASSNTKAQRQTLVLKLGVAATFISLCVMVVTWFVDEPTPQSPLSGTLMVLPVQHNLAGNDHDWVTYGAMDQLINKLTPSNDMAIADLNYVMSSMRLANVDDSPDTASIARIFDVSGAALVVGTELSGSVEDYRLSYSLYFSNDVKRGVIFAPDITASIDQLAEIIAGYTMQSILNDSQAEDEFNNEIIARAVTAMQQENYAIAKDLLTTVIQLEPHNLIAHRLLGESLISLNETEQAHQVLEKGIELGLQRQSKELTRLYFFYAVNLIKSPQGIHGERLKTALQQANDYADLNKDWLYKAYLSELAAKLANHQNQTQSAVDEANQALHYFNIVRCPIGSTRMELLLAQFYREQGDATLEQVHRQRAESIIEQRKLDFLLNEEI